ncbi:DNA replication and repair protein RecF, partial [Candidatus Berkelbacteria bacterium CG_4_9_14_3_um_filter_33_5]
MLNKITLENFRSFKKKSFKFSEKTQIIGKNGSGKSNLLEAIRYSSIFKSFRVKREKYLINNENEYFNLKSSFENNDGDKKEIFVNFSDKKTVSINKNKVPVSKLIGEIPTVLFWEDDLNILLGSPSYRRKFINSAICQYSKIYLKDLVEYNRVIKQRNRQLFLISVNRLNENLLDIWDEQLVILNRKI